MLRPLLATRAALRIPSSPSRWLAAAMNPSSSLATRGSAGFRAMRQIPAPSGAAGLGVITVALARYLRRQPGHLHGLKRVQRLLRQSRHLNVIPRPLLLYLARVVAHGGVPCRRLPVQAARRSRQRTWRDPVILGGTAGKPPFPAVQSAQYLRLPPETESQLLRTSCL
jgi:hypothetical protein